MMMMMMIITNKLCVKVADQKLASLRVESHVDWSTRLHQLEQLEQVEQLEQYCSAVYERLVMEEQAWWCCHCYVVMSEVT